MFIDKNILLNGKFRCHLFIKIAFYSICFYDNIVIFVAFSMKGINCNPPLILYEYLISNYLTTYLFKENSKQNKYIYLKLIIYLKKKL